MRHAVAVAPGGMTPEQANSTLTPRRPSPAIWLIATVGAAFLHVGALAAMLAPVPEEDDLDVGAPAIGISLDFTTSRAASSDLPPGPEAEASQAATAAAPQTQPVEQAHAPQETPTTDEDADRVVTREAAERVTEEPVETPARQQTDVAPSQEAAGSEATAPVEIEKAKEASSTTAPVLGAGRSDARVRAAWQKRLVAHLDRNKRYPSGDARKSATVVISFSIDRTGRLVKSSIVKSSGDASFDSAALAMMRRADPVPAPPPVLADDGLTFTVPVVFRERGRRGTR